MVLAGVDAEGHLKDPTASHLRGAQVDVTVTVGELVTVPGSVFLPRLPECSDGVDNDRDGRVDLDDPDCAGDAEGEHECVPTASGTCPDTSP